MDELIDYITFHGSTFRKDDSRAIVSTLAEAMAEKIAEGYKIDLAELGKVYPTLNCEGAETMQDFDPDKHIKAARVNWKPGNDFKDFKQKADFREDLTRRKLKEALKADMERWSKEEE